MSIDVTALRALIVTDYYRPLIGGSIRSTELLARHLTRRGHTIAVATSWQPGDSVHQCDDDGIDIYRIRDLSSRMRWLSEDPYKHNPPPFPDPEAAWRLRGVVRDFRPQLIHSYGWISHSMVSALLGMDIPFLLSVRDYGNVCSVGTLVRQGQPCSGPAPAKCLACARERFGGLKGAAAVAGVYSAGPLLRSKTTAVHAVSRFAAQTIDSCLHVPNARAVVIPNFHEEESVEPPDPELIARLPSEPFILFVGGFRKIKGIEELFEAYESLSNPPPLVMVGTMTSDSPRSFPPRVTVITDVPHATVMAMWERALFGVLPTRAPEALGNVVHEAMSKGRAMIGTRPGGQEDMIEDGETGLIVPGGDAGALATAMARLIADRELREHIGHNAERRARAFTPEVVMPKIEALYRKTIAAHRDRAR